MQARLHLSSQCPNFDPSTIQKTKEVCSQKPRKSLNIHVENQGKSIKKSPIFVGLLVQYPFSWLDLRPVISPRGRIYSGTPQRWLCSIQLAQQLQGLVSQNRRVGPGISRKTLHRFQCHISIHIISYHIIYHIISYHIIYHIISYHIISYHIIYIHIHIYTYIHIYIYTYIHIYIYTYIHIYIYTYMHIYINTYIYIYVELDLLKYRNRRTVWMISGYPLQKQQLDGCPAASLQRLAEDIAWPWPVNNTTDAANNEIWPQLGVQIQWGKWIYNHSYRGCIIQPMEVITLTHHGYHN